jgi:hypothetical protein
LPSWLKSFAARKKPNLEEPAAAVPGTDVSAVNDYGRLSPLRGRSAGDEERDRDRDWDQERHRNCYGDSRGSEKSLKRIDISKQYCFDINKQINGARGESELCTLIEARVAEFNHVVTAPHTCLSYEHTNMTQI